MCLLQGAVCFRGVSDVGDCSLKGGTAVGMCLLWGAVCFREVSDVGNCSLWGSSAVGMCPRATDS